MICDHGPVFGIVAHTASVCSFGTEAMVFKTSKILADVYRAIISYATVSTVSCTVSVYPLFIVSLVAAAEMLELPPPAMVERSS